jgi:zinc protease
MTLARIRVAFSSVVAVLLAAAWTTAVGQAPLPGRETTAESVAKYALSEQMPVDPEVTLGTLPNGLRYYVRANARPARRAELRLVVKAGSALEEDDQQGLAHFVEHMLFEGTKNFPRQGISEFLGTLGVGIGPDANAQTSYDDTQYLLRVPTDVPGVLDRALLVLEDWAQGATFDPDAIERQRGIVLSEWRMHLGAGERTTDKLRQVQLEGSRYAVRKPIGKPEIIERAQREDLLRFYRDWYRPDLMAVIVVGDVDREAVARMIRSRFSSLTSPSQKRPRPTFDVPERPGTRYAIVTDKETTTTAVAISDLRPARNQGSVGGYRDLIVDQLFGAILDARLDELSQRENAPFLRAAADRHLFPMPRTKDEALIQALVANDGVERGLAALVTEIERVSRFGVTETELARAKQARLAGYERVVAESPDRESASRADEYTRNFLQDEALPTIWQELAFQRRFVPGVTIEEVNALARDWFPDHNRLVVVFAPEASGVVLPTEQQLAAAVKSALNTKLEAYVDDAGGDPLMDKPPAAGTIVKTTPRPEAGITEWTLSNGATVVLKPTKLKEDQILFRATAPGGTSLASDADFIPARVADDVVNASGVGRFSDVVLNRMLSGKAVGVRPFIGEINHGMAGGSTPKDLETMMQLVYLRFTQPRADKAAFAALAAQARGLLANQLASPDIVFNQTIDSALSGNHLRRQPETPATVEKWDLEKSLAFYKARFADASNFTFVFVGSFTPEGLKPLVETYIASLPATRSKETWRDPGITLPTGVIERTIRKGIAPKSQVALVFSGPFPYDERHLLAFRAMTLTLQSRLFDTIRQELGGTYSIEVSPEAHKLPRPEYTVRIEWTCDPAQTESLVQRVFDEIEFVRGTTYQPGQVVRIRDALRREFERSSEDNGYVLNQIARRYAEGDTADLSSIVNLQDRIATLTGEEISEAARTYLNTKSYVKVTLMPEGK